MSNHAAFLNFLREQNACSEAADWAAAQPSLAACWTENPRADWLLWLLRNIALTDEQQLAARLLACDFAERVLPIYERKYPGDTRPHDAVMMARRFARGEVSSDELRAAYAAAYASAYAAAYASAYAADASAYAADAAAADAAAAAVYAAAAADAADAAYAATYAAARTTERTEQRRLILAAFPSMPWQPTAE